jgi:hypothetical protein
VKETYSLRVSREKYDLDAFIKYLREYEEPVYNMKSAINSAVKVVTEEDLPF